MLVKIEFTVDIDPEAWAAEYEVERHAVRSDVRQYVETTVRAVLADRGVLR